MLTHFRWEKNSVHMYQLKQKEVFFFINASCKILKTVWYENEWQRFLKIIIL